jgi:glycosyltransferase involved in cell wall biosynthesis
MNGGVAVVTEIIAPYRIPVFNELSRLLDGRLHVVFLNETEGRRDWPVYRDEIDFSYEVLGGARTSVPYRGDRQPVYLAPPLYPRLTRGDYRVVVVGGWNHLECYQALAWCRRRGRRFVLWSETPLLDGLPVRPLRSWLKRLVVRYSEAFAVPGPSAARYLAALGAASDRVHQAPNAVDNAFWAARPAGAERASTPTLLYAGRLAEAKGVDVALRAFAGSRLAGKAELLVAGDGPQRAALERLAGRGVRFLGSQDRESLRRLYHSAHLLVFPSRYDPWGLVLNEAACAGLAAVASDGAGGTRDMIRDGANGIVVEAGSVEELRAALDRVADDPALPGRLGEAAALLALEHTPRACATGLGAAVG